jgi:hypothetical protein
MTFTFDPTLSTPLSRVRQHVGDTTAPGEVADETITYYLGLPKSELASAAQIAWDLAAKYAKVVKVVVDDQSVDPGKISENYVAMAKRLEGQAADVPSGSNPAAFGGGIIVTGIGDCRGLIDDCCDPYSRHRF